MMVSCSTEAATSESNRAILVVDSRSMVLSEGKVDISAIFAKQ